MICAVGLWAGFIVGVVLIGAIWITQIWLEKP